MGYVGNNLGSINSARSAESRRDRIKFEADLKYAEEKPVREWTERAARSQGQLMALTAEEAKLAAIRMLRHKLTSEPSPEFSDTCEKYDGRFKSNDEVAAAIRNSFDEFLKSEDHPSYEDSLFISEVVFANFQYVDSTKASTYTACLHFVIDEFKKLDEFADHAIEQVYGTPVEPPVEVPAGSQEAVNPYKYGSREYEKFDREQYRQSVLNEKFKGDEYQNALATIQNDARKTLSGPDQVKFLSCYTMPAQRRRFPSMEYFRLEFCEFFNSPEILNESDRDLMAHNRQVNGMSADQVATLVGRNRSYADNPHAGIRQ